MKTSLKFILLLAVCLVAFILAFTLGSVGLTPGQVFSVFAYKLAGKPLPVGVDATVVSIIWRIRLPRSLAAFAVGAALSVSGLVFQSVLGNPLASSYTLGVSSGAALGAATVLALGLSFLGIFTMPAVGFLFGLATVFLAIGFAARIDKGLKNNTIILVGMVFSLFVNALLTLVNALHRENMQRLLLWQMGSFASKTNGQIAILWGSAFVGVFLLQRFSREMDILTFGDEQSRALGVNSSRVKLWLLTIASLLTGTAVSFTGTIGFVDLIAPHIVRKIFGASHRVLVVASALFGGAFMVIADTVARTVIAPVDLPVGAVTALLGAPFFAWLYGTSTKHKKI